MSCKFRFNPYIWSGLAFIAILAYAGASDAAAPKDAQAQLERQFAGVVKPFMQTYCVSCHGKNKPQAQLDLTAFANVAAVTRRFPHWNLVMERLEANEMPPPKAGKQPSRSQREAVVAWIRAVREYEAKRTAGDPGPVLARRLSNAEYDYSIRDLTGVDMKAAKEFPVDPANQEGFDNSGESLTFSPALMKKYAQAATNIAERMALTSRGLEFASHPILAETDRDKYCILRIVDFYRKQPTDFADYFQAAWRFRHRAALGSPTATLQTVAADAKVSARYLELVWNALNAPNIKAGPIAKLQEMWKALPQPERGRANAERAACEAMRDWTAGLRKKLAWKFSNLRVPGGFSDGGQCFVLWKDRQYASHRRLLNPSALQTGGAPKSDLYIPKEESARAPYLESFNLFCSVFPDAFYIAERGRMFVDDPGDQGRLLTAGLHNSMGYFRDDTPLMEIFLDDKGREELNRLWLDFDMVAFIPERMHLEFFVYERAEAATITDSEFNFARAEDKGALSDEKIKLLGDLYMAKAKRNGGEKMALQAIEDHFKWVSKTIRYTEKARIAAEPLHLKSLLDFARRAYRRPLSEAEKNRLLAFYRSLRQKDGLPHEDAMRDTVASVLMSPNFLFRLDLEPAKTAMMERTATRLAANAPAVPPRGNDVQPLSDYALASRLSYFLWSSIPDEELLARAAAGDLHRPEVLVAQTRRMLKSPRARALAVEFGGNWLDFRRFEEHNAVDRERFPAFNDDLRTAMFEEPLRFLLNMFQENGSALELLYGKHTFVNSALAQHYRMSDVKTKGAEWVRVDNADRYGRGGILPMAAFLTQNSPGLRTSPVKRGYWVVRRVLGETIPPPPAVVPELPKDESKMGDLTLRQTLEKHRSNPACAGCHARFDSYGLVFEGYGPIGDLRERDLGGRLVDSKAPFPGGVERTGVAGLKDFIRQKRQNDFLDNFSRKLLSYALGRVLQLSDDLLLREMKQAGAANGYRAGSLIETIVTSRQFRNRRASAILAKD